MKFSRKSEIKLIFLLAIALVIFISLITFDTDDIKLLTSSPSQVKHNVTGFVGAYLAWVMLFLMGLGSYLLPLLIVVWGVISLVEDKPKKISFRIFGALFSVLAISSILSLTGVGESTYRFYRGGLIGLSFSDFLLKYLGTAGTFIIITVLFLLSLLITTDFLIFPFIAWTFKIIKKIPTFIFSILSKIKFKRIEKRPAQVKKTGLPETVRVKSSTMPTKELKKEDALIAERIQKFRDKNKKEEEKQSPASIEKKPKVYDKPYEYPPHDILDSPPPVEDREIKENYEDSSKILEETLNDFGVEAKVVKISRGPVITRYEIEPASGVKMQKITSLSDNIALVMKATSVRIVAPIPGKGTVGIEVPNQKTTIVYLKELISSKEYKKETSKLKLALGKDISGASIVANLADMPHLLIAGTTGSGKTICVNAIISSLLFNASPDELKFVMIDPKRVELAAFNDLPHLLTPVVIERKKVVGTLEWLVNEMDRRYELLSKVGVRNIDGYNKKVETENLAILPYIVVIIDELHDLMLVSPQEVENMIMRIAQLSRAVGIHMIIATQRPSVDVITGVIKANLPSRISFKVASKVDSRTVLDLNGAEKLLGRGDMLFVEPGNSKPIRGQGSLVSDSEIDKLVAFIKAQREPEFAEEIAKDENKPQHKKFEKDEIYEEAVKLVLQTKQASVSMIQRRLGVGYTRAARLIDMMEDENIVGPYQGSKPRDILIENPEGKN